jgi:hypothetical protein
LVCYLVATLGSIGLAHVALLRAGRLHFIEIVQLLHMLKLRLLAQLVSFPVDVRDFKDLLQSCWWPDLVDVLKIHVIHFNATPASDLLRLLREGGLCRWEWGRLVWLNPQVD